jgi:hypothetical protein
MEVLTLTKRTSKGNFFKSDKGEYWLRNVDRKYEGRRKKPVYYLSEITESGTSFISGFFSTKDPSIFSFDVKNNVGMKEFMTAQFCEQGEKILLAEVTKG